MYLFVVTLGLIPIGSLLGGLNEAEKPLVGAEVCPYLRDSGRTGPASPGVSWFD